MELNYTEKAAHAATATDEVDMTGYDSTGSLERLNIMISMPVMENVQAAIVIWAINNIYAETTSSFRFHPGITLLFRALSALEQRSCVEIVDIIKNLKLRKLPSPVERMKKKLVLHRDRLSHPFLPKWGTTEKQEFVDSRRDHTDIRSAFILNLQNSINTELIAQNRPTQNQDIPVTFEMASAIYGILSASASKELSESFLPNDQIVLSLHKFREAFYAFCKKHVE